MRNYFLTCPVVWGTLTWGNFRVWQNKRHLFPMLWLSPLELNRLRVFLYLFKWGLRVHQFWSIRFWIFRTLLSWTWCYVFSCIGPGASKVFFVLLINLWNFKMISFFFSLHFLGLELPVEFTEVCFLIAWFWKFNK